MKITSILFLLFLLTFGCSKKKQTESYSISADRLWAFSTGDSIQWAQPAFEDSSWTRISSQHSWEAQGFTGYDGFGWYRQQILIPDNFRNPVKKNGGLVVTYSNADDADEFYFNGTLVGATGSLPPQYESRYGVVRKYIVPAELVLPGEKNLMAVRVYDGGGDGGIISGAITIYPLSEVSQIPLKVVIDDEDWVFTREQNTCLGIKAVNQSDRDLKMNLSLKVTTDDFQPVSESQKQIRLSKRDSLTTVFQLDLPSPGFFKCTAWAEKDGIRGDETKFNIGFEPEKISSPVDAMPDFEEFWKTTRAELDKVAPAYRMELLKDNPGDVRKIYHVKMQSYGNVTIEGYYAAPKSPGKHPVIIGYMGYGSDPWIPDSKGNPGFAEFILSVRGQGIQKASNPYGDWIVYGLENRDDYYYRGAFMDLVRAVDFVASRPEVDAEKIVAEGGSQGGAFTLAASALDKRIKAAAPTVPFLSDYPDYFKIAPWPASAFTGYLARNPGMGWDSLYTLLSYFDVKNLAPWIECPVLMAVGLQDNVCPPHTNFAAYNQIRSEKKVYIFPDQGHSVPGQWYQIRMDFFREKLGIRQE